ncbi:MAG TPA: urate hydroxylase PuuD, partial [Steroidobacteraceae bacterium]
MTAYLLDWLNLLARWLHLVAGIAWIGSSFYFIWLDNHLLAPADATLAGRGVGGELWAVHGGGFYNTHKYRVAPASLPPSLHWFYWEAYTTFLSGLFLLALLYYGQAQLYLIDPAVAALSQPAATAIGIAFLAGGWLVYDGLCRSRLGRNGPALGAVLAALLSAAAWALCRLFSGRGAYMEFGAMLGTIMAANVLFVIIPGQRELVRARREGREPDPAFGIAGKLRSTHNTYFTLPVLFVMISPHYPMTYGARENWLVLIAICSAGVWLRTYFVARHKARERGGRTSPLTAALGLLTLAGVAFALLPRAPGPRAVALSSTADFAHVQAIVAARCASCHPAKPRQPGFVAGPNGVLLDTPER